jgi:hypothetical protein
MCIEPHARVLTFQMLHKVHDELTNAGVVHPEVPCCVLCPGLPVVLLHPAVGI